MKDKILDFTERIIGTYTVIYLVVIHIIAIAYLSYDNLDFTQPTADIIGGVVLVTLGFIICDFCFLMPSLMVLAFSTLASFFASLSVVIFLILSLFEACGSEAVNVLQYGFFQTLLFCILITPFGIMNLISTVFIVSHD